MSVVQTPKQLGQEVENEMFATGIEPRPSPLSRNVSRPEKARIYFFGFAFRRTRCNFLKVILKLLFDWRKIRIVIVVVVVVALRCTDATSDGVDVDVKVVNDVRRLASFFTTQ